MLSRDYIGERQRLSCNLLNPTNKEIFFIEFADIQVTCITIFRLECQQIKYILYLRVPPLQVCMDLLPSGYEIHRPPANEVTSNALTELQWIGGPDSPYKHDRTSVEVLKEPRLLLFYFKEPINESEMDTYTEEENEKLSRDQKSGSMLYKIGGKSRKAVQQYKTELPPANYMKAMDIWLFICIFIVFSTLVEFALSYNNQQKQCIKHATEMRSANEVKKTESEKVTHCWILGN
ncbi:hypothetical protein HNY73_002004 [Argiope bruennichi]|uniref:Uncharacterized protein n=1 Tax=Argiope bruennichi TaxID=94029 RepID=A0A8T0FUV7_ARGBR|nr:hypothetical protein HNY73_002004 [Argiope bruennichi]